MKQALLAQVLTFNLGRPCNLPETLGHYLLAVEHYTRELNYFTVFASQNIMLTGEIQKLGFPLPVFKIFRGFIYFHFEFFQKALWIRENIHSPS